LTVIKTELEEKKTLEEEVKKRLQENNHLQNHIRNLESQLRQSETKINTIKSQEQTLKDRISELEKILNSIKIDNKRSEDQFSLKLKDLKQQLEATLIELKVSQENLSIKNSEISKINSQVVSMTSKLEDLKKHFESASSKLSESEQKTRNLKQKNTSLEKELAENEKIIQTRDLTIKEILQKMTHLESESMSKDSILLQKDSHLSKLVKENEEMKKNIQQAHSKFRLALAEEIKKFESILETKETEIKLLKDMMRSGQTQLKQREGELSRMKNALQPQVSRNNLENKKNVEGFPAVEKFLNFFKGVDDLKAFKENLDSQPDDEVSDDVRKRFLVLFNELQKGVRKFLEKSIEVKSLAGRVVFEKDEVKVKSVLEICGNMCP
jgi:chromosome segregation ATPase